MRETRQRSNWGFSSRLGQPGDSYIHPFGAFGEPLGGVEFQHHWLRGQREGQRRFALEDFSYSVVAARNNAFEFPNEDSKSIRSTYSYAYHFDAGLYAAYLRSWAMERGVRRIEGQVCDVSRHPTTGDLWISRSNQASMLPVTFSSTVPASDPSCLEASWRCVAGWTHWLPSIGRCRPLPKESAR